MMLKNKFAVIAGSALIAGSLMAGAAFAATGAAEPAATANAAEKAAFKAERIDQAVTDGKLTQAQADLLKEIEALRRAAMEKLQTESKALVDQAVTDGKVTQEEADSLLSHKGGHGFGKGGKKGGFGRGGFHKGAPVTDPAPATDGK